ncbi:hypothetical protein CFOL_v3_23789 [Cephalotus follicularis]|uniref:Uncharacterized protein n=1 Tax=Cephalotus follicularis TaxID=3775 RepID=A0A1Q3CJN5_CEPFO|nr:hypothetical protein CFOL_v3_23789 [Cephalotus follicularis]
MSLGDGIRPLIDDKCCNEMVEYFLDDADETEIYFEHAPNHAEEVLSVLPPPLILNDPPLVSEAVEDPHVNNDPPLVSDGYVDPTIVSDGFGDQPIVSDVEVVGESFNGVNEDNSAHQVKVDYDNESSDSDPEVSDNSEDEELVQSRNKRRAFKKDRKGWSDRNVNDVGENESSSNHDVDDIGSDDGGINKEQASSGNESESWDSEEHGSFESSDEDSGLSDKDEAVRRKNRCPEYNPKARLPVLELEVQKEWGQKDQSMLCIST